jgi:ubiquinol-cytochrome c reductase cytochrome c subunit
MNPMTNPRRPGLRPLTLALASVLTLLVTGLIATASPRDLAQPPGNDDPEEREFRRKTAERSVRDNCLICHTDELITSQRLTSKQWKAEVEKMVGWGSPLPKEEQEPVIDFLSSEYPADAAPARTARMTYAEALALERAVPDPKPSAGDPARGASAYASNCANCHGADGQGAELGPNLVEKPVLYRSRDYEAVVRQGRGRMPAFAPLINEAAEADMLAWLRARRYHPPLPAPK